MIFFPHPLIRGFIFNTMLISAIFICNFIVIPEHVLIIYNLINITFEILRTASVDVTDLRTVGRSQSSQKKKPWKTALNQVSNHQPPCCEVKWCALECRCLTFYAVVCWNKLIRRAGSVLDYHGGGGSGEHFGRADINHGQPRPPPASDTGRPQQLLEWQTAGSTLQKGTLLQLTASAVRLYNTSSIFNLHSCLLLSNSCTSYISLFSSHCTSKTYFKLPFFLVWLHDYVYKYI